MFIPNCLYTPTVTDVLVNGAFDLISPDILELLVNATNGEQYGEDRAQDRQLSVQIIILNLHLQVAHNEMVALNAQGLLDMDALHEKYKIDCIRKTLACKGYDIDPLVDYYGLSPHGLDGVDYMGIENDNVWEIG